MRRRHKVDALLKVKLARKAGSIYYACKRCCCEDNGQEEITVFYSCGRREKKGLENCQLRKNAIKVRITTKLVERTSAVFPFTVFFFTFIALKSGKDIISSSTRINSRQKKHKKTSVQTSVVDFVFASVCSAAVFKYLTSQMEIMRRDVSPRAHC